MCQRVIPCASPCDVPCGVTCSPSPGLGPGPLGCALLSGGSARYGLGGCAGATAARMMPRSFSGSSSHTRTRPQNPAVLRTGLPMAKGLRLLARGVEPTSSPCSQAARYDLRFLQPPATARVCAVLRAPSVQGSSPMAAAPMKWTALTVPGWLACCNCGLCYANIMLSSSDDMIRQQGVVHGRRDARRLHSPSSAASACVATAGRQLGGVGARMQQAIVSELRWKNLAPRR